MRRGLIIGGSALLAVMALAAWVRRPAVTPTPSYFSATPAGFSQPGAPAALAGEPAAVYGSAPAVYGAGQPVTIEPVAQRRVIRQRVVSSRPHRVYYKKRKFSHSAAIVGGSAAGGAAIGALAGGGKGAAIGALAGGGAGLIYDRATHKKRVER